MTRRFKVFVALNLAGFIGLAAWLRRDVPPPDPGDLVMAEETVPVEDNAHPDYMQLELHIRAPASRQATNLDALDWELLRRALSKPRCQRGEHKYTVVNNRGQLFLDRAVLKAFQSVHSREVLAQNWAGAVSNLNDQARYSRHMEEFSLLSDICPPQLKSRHQVLQTAQTLASMPGAQPDQIEAILGEVPPISDIFPSFARQFYTMCVIILTEGKEPESFLQLNRTLASLMRFLEMQRLASSTPLNSSAHAELSREFQKLEDLLANQGKFRVLWSANYNGEWVLYYTQVGWLIWPSQRCLMDTRLNLIRTLVASMRYQRDHGNLPTRLEDLVPAYLPSVPLDAYDGLPLGYDPASGLLFSRWPLKEDGKPELGEDVLTKTTTTHPAHANDSTVLRIPPAKP